MYGLINRAIQDLALQLGGEDTWTVIKTRAGVHLEAFVGMDVYGDDVTYRLVDAASAVLGLPADEVLRAFGRHWILHTGRKSYGSVYETMGRTLPEFLDNLDAMHARLVLTMPDLRSPSFTCEDEGDGRLRVHYRSERVGLAPMVVGVLEGLGEYFALLVEVTHEVDRAAGHDHDEFLVTTVPR